MGTFKSMAAQNERAFDIFDRQKALCHEHYIVEDLEDFFNITM